jgi:hypothetical protein
MKFDDMLLGCLGEECAEIIKAVSKINRFGWNGCQYPGREAFDTNTHRLRTEIQDTLALIRMVQDHFNLGPWDPKALEQKEEKTIKYIKLSKEMGCIDGPVPEKFTR